MTSVAKSLQQQDAEAALDAEVDAIIDSCGDAHAAVRALVTLAYVQEEELAKMRAAVSHGFGRGRFLPLA